MLFNTVGYGFSELGFNAYDTGLVGKREHIAGNVLIICTAVDVSCCCRDLKCMIGVSESSCFATC